VTFRSFVMSALLVVALALPAARAEDGLALEQYAGKVVVLDFWASWCVPCRRSFPWLNTMHDKYAEQGLVIVGVNLDQERADADGFLAEFPPRFRIYFDVNKDLAREFGVEAMPTSFVLGRDGEVHAQHYGFMVRKQQEYEAVITGLLQDKE